MYRRLQHLLDGKDAEFNKEFCLAEVSTIKEMFAQHFFAAPAAAAASSPLALQPGSPASSAPPRLTRALSSGLSDARSGTHRYTYACIFAIVCGKCQLIKYRVLLNCAHTVAS